jgi:hypothetical protein
MIQLNDGNDATFLLVSVDAKKVKQQEDVDAGLLQSNIWATLFRGGFTNTGKLQRSLSGHHVSPRILLSCLLMLSTIRSCEERIVF